ncbi:MAG: carbohydrate-binding domain-containing protein, partial [Bacteroidota bacterium]
MTMVFRQKTLGLLFVFVVAAFGGSAVYAQNNFKLHEYFVFDESEFGAGDDYLLFETNLPAGETVSYQAKVNGRTIERELTVAERGYVMLPSPANGIYDELLLVHNGTKLLREQSVKIMSRLTDRDFDDQEPLPGMDTDVEIAEEPEDFLFGPAKMNDCTNNKVNNRSFESNLNHWTTSGSVSVETASNRVFSGSRSVRLNTPNSEVRQEFSIGAGRAFCFSGYAKNHSSSGNTSFELQIENSSGHILGEWEIQVQTQSGFNYYSVEGVTPPNTASIQIELQRDASTNDDAWFDLICFEDKGTNIVIDGGNVPGSFMADCDLGEEVDIYTSDVDCDAFPAAEITIPNPANVTQVVAEIVYKGEDPGSKVYIYASNGNFYELDKIPATGGSSNFDIYRGLIPTAVGTISHVPLNGDCKRSTTKIDGFQSLAVYAYRTNSSGGAASGVFTELTGYNDIQQVTIPIPTASLTRTVNLSLPVSEITLDGRYMNFLVKIGGSVVAEEYVTFSGGINTPCCIDVIEIEVPAVPGSVDELVIEIDTRNGISGRPNGQSYTVAGLAYADLECPKTDGDCEFVFAARGNCGGEQVKLLLDGSAVATYVLTDHLLEYSFNNFLSGQTVEVQFINDGNVNSCDRNVYLDYIEAGGLRYETSASATVTDPGCNNLAHEALNCNGKFIFGSICCPGTSSGDLECEASINNGGFHTLANCSVEVCVDDHLSLSINPNGTSPTWTGPNGFSATGNDIDLGTMTSAKAGDYTATLGSGSCEISTTIHVTVNERPDASVTVGDAVCGDVNGMLTISFADNPSRTHIAFSTDGGSTYRNSVADDSGSVTYTVAPGSYNVFARWDDEDCPTDLGSYTVSASDDGPSVIAYCGEEPDLSKHVQNTILDCHPAGPQNLPHAVYAQGFVPGEVDESTASGRLWEVSGTNSFEEFNNGTARLKLTVRNIQNTNLRLTYDVVLSGRTQTTPPNSPKLDLCVDIEDNDWYYYPTFSGTVTGSNRLAGLVLSVTGLGTALQVGTGANLKHNDHFGFSSWMGYNVISQPTTGAVVNAGAQFDFNLKLDSDVQPKFGNEDECDPICAGEETTISALGARGTAPYTYTWDNGLGSGRVKTITPNTTTTYTVTIEDANGCTSTDQVTITVNAAAWDEVRLGHDVDNCANDCNGSLFVDPNFSVTGEYFVEYTFNGSVVRFPTSGALTGAGGMTIGNLCAGTYSNITIVGTHTGCRAVWPGDVEISEPTPPSVTVSSTDADCNGAGGTVTATPAGGSGNYTYLWSNGATTQTVTGLNVGTYSVVVTDADNSTCTAEGSVDVVTDLSTCDDSFDDSFFNDCGDGRVIDVQMQG